MAEPGTTGDDAAGDPPLHTLDPTGRFTCRAGDYARHRPSYPSPSIDAILRGIHARSPVIADLGAGTGIFSNLLAERGARVLAVEPNAAMRSQATPHPRVMWVDAGAERTTLSDASVDGVTAAQSFHWFRAREAITEIARILRPGGALALVWNVRDDRDPFTAAYSAVMADASRGRSIDRGEFDRTLIESRPEFGPLMLQEFPSRQPLDEPGVAGRAISASYFPTDPPLRDALLTRLTAAFREHRRDGLVAIAYVTRVWMATRQP